MREVRTGRRGRPDTDASAVAPATLAALLDGDGAQRPEDGRRADRPLRGHARSRRRARHRRLIRRWADHRAGGSRITSTGPCSSSWSRWSIRAPRTSTAGFPSPSRSPASWRRRQRRRRTSGPSSSSSDRRQPAPGSAIPCVTTSSCVASDRSGCGWAISFKQAGHRVVAVTPDGNDAAVNDCSSSTRGWSRRATWSWRQGTTGRTPTSRWRRVTSWPGAAGPDPRRHAQDHAVPRPLRRVAR